MEVRIEKMNGSTNAIDALWKRGFFRDEKKQTKNVSQVISKEFGINPTNITDLLKKRPYLKNDGGWIQRYPPKEEDEISVYYFEPGKPRSCRQNFINILKGLKGDIKICDPYLTKDSLEALAERQPKIASFIFLA